MFDLSGNGPAGCFKLFRGPGNGLHVAAGGFHRRFHFTRLGPQHSGHFGQAGRHFRQADGLTGDIADGFFDFAFQRFGQGQHFGFQHFLSAGKTFRRFHGCIDQLGPHSPQHVDAVLEFLG